MIPTLDIRFGLLMHEHPEYIAGGASALYKGWFTTEAALIEAYATAVNGNYASVGSTDTFWLWDSDTLAWKDSGSSGGLSVWQSALGVISSITPGDSLRVDAGAIFNSINGANNFTINANGGGVAYQYNAAGYNQFTDRIGIGGIPNVASMFHIRTVGPGLRLSDPTDTVYAEQGFTGPDVYYNFSAGITSYGIQFEGNDIYRATPTGLTLSGDLLPGTTDLHSIGSASQQWKDIFLTGGTIFLNNVPLALDGSSNLTFNGNQIASSTGSIATDATSVFNIDSNNAVDFVVKSAGAVPLFVDSSEDTLAIFGQAIKSVSAGAADNDKLVTQGYVDKANVSTFSRIYIDSVNGIASGKGSISDPVDSIDTATALRLVTDPDEDLPYVFVLGAGDYDSASSPIQVPDNTIFQGLGNITTITDDVELNDNSEITDLQVVSNNVGTDGIVKMTSNDCSIERCTLKTTSYSPTDVRGIVCTMSNGSITDSKIELQTNKADATLTAIYAANQDFDVRDVQVIFDGSQLDSATRIVAESNGSGDIHLANVASSHPEEFSDAFVENSTGLCIVSNFLAVGKSVNVGGVGAGYRSIQEAIDAVDAGTLVTVYPGTYTENITLKDGVTVKGMCTRTTIINGQVTYNGTEKAVLAYMKVANTNQEGIIINATGTLRLVKVAVASTYTDGVGQTVDTAKCCVKMLKGYAHANLSCMFQLYTSGDDVADHNSAAIWLTGPDQCNWIGSENNITITNTTDTNQNLSFLFDNNTNVSTMFHSKSDIVELYGVQTSGNDVRIIHAKDIDHEISISTFNCATVGTDKMIPAYLDGGSGKIIVVNSTFEYRDVNTDYIAYEIGTGKIVVTNGYFDVTTIPIAFGDVSYDITNAAGTRYLNEVNISRRLSIDTTWLPAFEVKNSSSTSVCDFRLVPQGGGSKSFRFQVAGGNYAGTSFIKDFSGADYTGDALKEATALFQMSDNPFYLGVDERTFVTIDTLGGVQVDGGFISNKSFLDYDFKINKATSGVIAYEYNAGDDIHNFNSVVKIGDDTNYTEVEADGTVVAHGDAQCYDDIKFPFIGRKLDTANGRIDYDYAELGVNFADDCRLAVTEQISMICQMNHDWVLGTALKPHIHWIQSSADLPNWVLQYRVYKNGGVIPAWTTVIPTATVFTYVSDPLPQISTFPDIDMTGIDTVSSFIDLKLYRDTLNTSGLHIGLDPLTGNALAKEFDVHYLRDMLGSRTEYDK